MLTKFLPLICFYKTFLALCIPLRGGKEPLPSGKEPANAGDIRDVGSISKSEISPGGRHGNPL